MALSPKVEVIKKNISNSLEVEEEGVTLRLQQEDGAANEDDSEEDEEAALDEKKGNSNKFINLTPETRKKTAFLSLLFGIDNFCTSFFFPSISFSIPRLLERTLRKCSNGPL